MPHKNYPGLLVGIALLGVGTAAGAEESLEARLLTCSHLQAGPDRLKCYDGLVNELNRQQANAQAARAAKAVAAPSNAAAPSTGEATADEEPGRIAGWLSRFKRDDEPRDEVSSTLLAVRTLSDGSQEFELANGQVWQEVGRGPLTTLRDGDAIVVRRASLGSFLLSGDKGRSVRVRRVR